MKTKIVLLSCMLLVAGCGSELATGIAIGVGGSAAASEGQQLAEQSKAALIAQLLALREELDEATDPAEVESLRKQLAALEKKKEIVDISEIVANKVAEGAAKNWGTADPQEQKGNIMWALDALLGVGLVWQTRKRRILEKGIAKNSADATPEEAHKLYEDIQKYNGKLLV